MPRDGSGNYTLPAGYTAITGEIIQPSQHNPPLEDLATAMTNSLARNGAAPMTGALDAGAFKVINVADATANTDAVNGRLLRETTTTMLTLGGTATAYTLALSAAQVLGLGLSFWAKANVTNSGGSTTLVITPGGGGAAFTAVNIRVINASGAVVDPPAGSMIAGKRYLFQYDPSVGLGGSYLLMNPSDVYSFRVWKNSAAQTTVAGAGAWSIVTWPTEVFDIGAAFGSNRWVPPAGLVMLTANITVTPIASGYMYLSISKNGAHVNNVSIRPCTASTVLTNQVTMIDAPIGTDYYEVFVMGSGGDLVVEGASSFAGAMIRAT